MKRNIQIICIHLFSAFIINITPKKFYRIHWLTIPS